MQKIGNSDQYEKVDKKRIEQKVQVTKLLEKIAQEMQGKSIKEKYDYIQSLKTQADAQYLSKKFQPALELYLRCIFSFQ